MDIKKSDILLDSVLRLKRRQAHANIKKLLLKSHPVEVANVIRQMSDSDGAMLFEFLRGSDLEAQVLAELGSRFFKAYLNLHPDTNIAAEILQKLPEDEAATLLAECSDEIKSDIVGRMQIVVRDEVTELLEYDAGSCGRIMAVNVFALNRNLTAGEAIQEIQNAKHVESLFYVYVTDDFEKLVGVVSLRQILQKNRAVRLADFMNPDVIRVRADQSQEEAAHLIEEYNLVCVPVVSEDSRLLGMVTVDDIIDYIRDEGQEDMLAMAGVETEAIEDYSFWRALLSRCFWYLLLFVGGILCAEILRQRIDFMEGLQWVIFLPLISRLGGSIATQTSTFLLQGLLNPGIERDRAVRAFRGQILVTFFVAIVLAVMTYGYAYFRVSSEEGITLGLVVGLVAVVLTSLIFGLFFPWVAEKIRINPLYVTSRIFHLLMDAVSLAVFLFFQGRWDGNVSFL